MLTSSCLSAVPPDLEHLAHFLRSPLEPLPLPGPVASIWDIYPPSPRPSVMSEPSETSGRPLASSTERAQQPESNIVHQPALTRTKDRKDRKTSKPSDDCSEQVKSTKSRRRSKDSKQVSPGPHTGSSRSEQRWTTSPGSMTSPLPPVHYTRTGRISKAKKGLKVHNCANCGRVSCTLCLPIRHLLEIIGLAGHCLLLCIDGIANS